MATKTFIQTVTDTYDSYDYWYNLIRFLVVKTNFHPADGVIDNGTTLQFVFQGEPPPDFVLQVNDFMTRKGWAIWIDAPDIFGNTHLVFYRTWYSKALPYSARP